MNINLLNEYSFINDKILRHTLHLRAIVQGIQPTEGYASVGGYSPIYT